MIWCLASSTLRLSILLESVMKKSIILGAVLLLFVGVHLQAQNCGITEKLADRTWAKFGRWQSNFSLIPYRNRTKKVVQGWKYIAGEGSPTIVSKYLNLNNITVKGSVTGQAQSTFVTSPSFNNTVKITIARNQGSGAANIFICSHGEDGVNQLLKKHIFSKNSSSKTKTFTLTAVKGKVITMVIQNLSAKEKFDFEVNAK